MKTQRSLLMIWSISIESTVSARIHKERGSSIAEGNCFPTATTSGHNFSRPDDGTDKTADGTASTSSSASTISSLESTSSPGCSLGSVTAEKFKPPPMKPVDKSHADTDTDGLEFFGSYLTDIKHRRCIMVDCNTRSTLV